MAEDNETKILGNKATLIKGDIRGKALKQLELKCVCNSVEKWLGSF